MTVSINLDELKNYFQIVVVMSERKESKIINHIAPMKFCNAEDYKSLGVQVSPIFSRVIQRRLCPDISEKETLYKVRNIHSNH